MSESQDEPADEIGRARHDAMAESVRQHAEQDKGVLMIFGKRQTDEEWAETLRKDAEWAANNPA